MADQDLIFELPPSSSGHLLFGENAPVFTAEAIASITFPAFGCDLYFAPRIEAQWIASFPAARLSALALPTTIASLSLTLPAFGLGGQLAYASRTARPTVGSSTTDWQKAFSQRSGATSPMQRTEAGPSGTASRFSQAVAARGEGRSRFVAAIRNSQHSTSGFTLGLPVRTQGRPSYQESERLRTGRSARHQNATGCRQQRSARHQDGIRTIREWLRSAYQAAYQDRVATVLERGGKALGVNRYWLTRHQVARVPPPGTHPSDPVIPPTPERCYTPSPDLVFAASLALDGVLLFVCERATPPPEKSPILVPVRRVYVVINNVSLHRLPDGLEIPAMSLSLSLDAASWAWGFDAQLPARAESLVLPTESGPVELIATINGTSFHLLSENIARERSFGNASIRVSGRGRTAHLAAPYAPVLSFSNGEARSARQLMDDVLTINGMQNSVSLGWSVDWGITDWNVPTGVFTRQSTWIEALTAIAEAAGAYLLPHPTDRQIRVRPRYPVVPWEWSSVTPDFVLPVDAVSRESLRWQEKPAYNRVFVCGQDIGVVGRVTRTGTAGEVLAPMVVDALITEAQAARQRGIAILSDTGRQIAVSLRLPVWAETGIIEPGAFIEYQDGSQTQIGLVRATQVEAGLPEVWQTLEVEAHA